MKSVRKDVDKFIQETVQCGDVLLKLRKIEIGPGDLIAPSVWWCVMNPVLMSVGLAVRRYPRT